MQELAAGEQPGKVDRWHELIARHHWLITFSAFRHRNFRLYFFGLLISITGVWAQSVAQEWLVYTLTDSALALGQVAFMAAVPVWVAGPWAGVVIDRFPRRNILLVTQILQMIPAFVLAGLTFAGRIEIWHIMVSTAIQGLATAFDAPARQSFVIEMVGREDLSNAIALNSTMFSLARFAGPAVGALILATLGTAWAFTVNGLTFLAILASLLIMRLQTLPRRDPAQPALAQITEGLRFVWHNRTIMALMALALTMGLFGSTFNTLIPVVTREVLGKGEIEFGMLRTAIGLGSIIGALMVAYLSSKPGRGRVLSIFNIMFPLSLLLFAASGVYWLALISLTVVGVTFIPQLSLCNMLIQSNIPDGIRGRVMGVYTLIIFGAFPLGALLGGGLANWFGAPVVIALNALVVLGIGILLRALVPGLRAAE